MSVETALEAVLWLLLIVAVFVLICASGIKRMQDDNEHHN